jgi:hypothetical protein
MIDPQSQKKVQTAISRRIAQDRHLLEELRRDARPHFLQTACHSRPRSSTCAQPSRS